MAGDLGDEAAKGGGFVVFGEAESGGVVAGVARSTVVARIVWLHPVTKILGANVAEVKVLSCTT